MWTRGGGLLLLVLLYFCCLTALYHNAFDGRVVAVDILAFLLHLSYFVPTRTRSYESATVNREATV